MTPATAHPDVLVVGAGVLGASAALELRGRGARVTLVDPGPLPHPDAASTDLSKLIRADYGSDLFYTELMEAALPRWRAMNARFGAELFHETGLLVLSTDVMAPGSFERDSFDLLSERGAALERLDAAAVRARFPAWREGAFLDGYFNPAGGWAESGKVVAALIGACRTAGVVVREGVRVAPLGAAALPVRGVFTEAGDAIAAGTVVIAAGALTPVLVPELADRITPVGQPVLHFAPADASPFSAPAFVPWAADIARTGWYGFPHHEGVVKVAHHGRGSVVDPSGPRVVPPGAETAFRRFLESSLPALASAPRVRSRLCLYGDMFDGDFLVDRHPDREGLVVVSGDSGHAFKFAPVLGTMIADRVERTGSGAWCERFGWRERGPSRTEHARAGATLDAATRR